MTLRRRLCVRALLLTALIAVFLGLGPGAALAMPGANGPAWTAAPAIALQALMASQQEALTAPDGAAYDYFGHSVALSGDTALIGARGATVNGAESRGAAYVFTRSGGQWAFQAKLTASDGAGGDRFGYSVALSGDTAAIGADVAGDADQGAVYVFTRQGAAWAEQAKLSVSASDAYPRFGCSVALSAGTLVAGASWSDVAGAADRGAAYVFTGGGSVWTPQAQLTAAAGASGDRFGAAVAVDGDTAVVGADVAGAAARGAAYVFTRSGGLWTERATLTASDGVALDQFGISVALSGGTALVGAQLAGGSIVDQGAAYVFTSAGSAWSQQARLTVAGSRYFGCSVALSGDTVVTGAMWDDGATTDRGAAYVYRRRGSVWTKQARLIPAGGRANDRFGLSVALSGDTALVGAPHEWLEGRASVFTDLLPAKPATPRARSPKGLISSRTPTVKWTAAAHAATYQVRVLRGSRVIARKSGVTATSWRCAPCLPRRVWLTWQVRATNAAGSSAWSAKRSFKVR